VGASTMPERKKKKLRCSLLFDEIQPGAVRFFHLFCRNNSAAKVCEL
jgi:hypothetical protein